MWTWVGTTGLERHLHCRQHGLLIFNVGAVGEDAAVRDRPRLQVEVEGE